MSAAAASIFERLYLGALAHHAAGDIAAAAADLRRAAAFSPGRVEPLIALGALANAGRSPQRALNLAVRALAINDQSIEGLYNHALAFEALGQYLKAASRYRQALAEGPGLAAALDRLGATRLRLGDMPAAVIAHHRATSCSPNDFGIRTNLAHALRLAGDHAGALAAYRKAFGRDPLNPTALINLGGFLAELGQADEARRAHRQALTLDPQAADGHHNLAAGGGPGERAAAYLRRALAVNPHLAAAHIDLGVHLQATVALDRSLAHYRKAAVLEPALASAHHNAAAVLLQQGSTDLAVPPFRRAASLAGSPSFHSDLLFCLCFQEAPDFPGIFRDHLHFDRAFARPLARSAGPHRNERSPDRILRIGYVSANLHRHPVGQALLGLFVHHDRSRFRIHAYAGNALHDDMTTRLRRHADDWQSIAGVSDADLAECVRQDRIDILVDCIGHLPQGRLLAFARRPAPIQVGFPVYPNTTGVAAIDYRIGDIHVSPPAQDRFYTEHLLRLPETYVAHHPSEDSDTPADRPPCETTGCFIFASFNNPAKLGPRTLAAWAEILRRAPAARLVLKWRGLTHHSPPVRALIDNGVSPDRIDIQGWARTAYAPYLAVDCCLDPIINGGNTTFDALWMGVPVITLRGEHLFARVGACLLTQVGLEELIADTVDDYVDIAVRLATNRTQLARVRQDLRLRVATSPAMNSARYTRHLEAAYRTIWTHWCAGFPPVALDIVADLPIAG